MGQKPLIIGICGGTGAGKTTITSRITQALSAANVIILEQDNYYKDFPELSLAERTEQNFDHPDSIDTPLLTEHLKKLRAGEAIERPTYDFTYYANCARRAARGDDSRRNIDFREQAATRIDGHQDFCGYGCGPAIYPAAGSRYTRAMAHDGFGDRTVPDDGAADAHGICRAEQALRRCDYSRRRAKRGWDRSCDSENPLTRSTLIFPELRRHPEEEVHSEEEKNYVRRPAGEQRGQLADCAHRLE